jgi:hypothetical protein
MSFSSGENIQLRPRQRRQKMLASEVTPGLWQEQSLMPISFMSRLVYKRVIEWMQTQKNIILTQNPGPGYAQAGEVLI